MRRGVFAMVWLVAGLVMVGPCRAGWISEVSLRPRPIASTSGTSAMLPAYIELSGLVSGDVVELVLIEARSGPRFGRVMQVIPVPAGQAVRVVAGGAWPANVLERVSTRPPALSRPDGDGRLDLDGARGILMFSRPTGLSPGVRIQFQPLPPDTELLDVVTFGPGGDARAYGVEPVLDSSPGGVIARHNVDHARPWASLYLVADADRYNVMTEVEPAFAVNPGYANRPWRPNPEPTSLAVLVAMGWWWSGRRGRAVDRPGIGNPPNRCV